jgi:transcriptional regulator with XRE-family HTH domain
MGMSQEKLAEILGITFQQVQKYEKGVNRVGAGRLQVIAKALNTPIAYFYENSPDEAQQGPDAADSSVRMLHSPEGLRLVRAFAALEKTELRRKVLDLLEAMTEDRIREAS